MAATKLPALASFILNTCERVLRFRLCTMKGRGGGAFSFWRGLTTFSVFHRNLENSVTKSDRSDSSGLAGTAQFYEQLRLAENQLTLSTLCLLTIRSERDRLAVCLLTQNKARVKKIS